MHSSFIGIYKKQKKKIESVKYYIPCYDVINNEIYFTEFFTEEIITKSTENLKDKDGRKKSYYLQPPLISKDEKLFKRRNKMGTSKLTNEEKKKLIQIKQENLIKCELSLRFKKMQIISGFNENNYLSINYYNYFSRPLYSHFFLPQNLKFYSLNNTTPIQNSIFTYSFIDVYIDFHLDSLVDIDLDKYLIELNENDEEYEYDNNLDEERKLEESQKIQIFLEIKRHLSDLNKNSKKISLFYVADTLIKDSVQLFEDNMNYLISKCEETLDNTDEAESRLANQELLLSNELNEEFENKLNYLMEKFYKIKNDKSKCFILKVEGYEEYLYGEDILAQYNFIRNKVRQKEVIKLILKSVPSYKIHPPLFNYPPIIRIDKYKNISYNELFNLYKKYYPNHEIIFRLYKTSKKQIERHLTKSLNRTNNLIKFTESGDCDFPLIININKVNHIYNFIKWFNNENYCNSQLILPYFNPLKTVRLKKKSKFEKIVKKIKNSLNPKKKNKRITKSIR